SGKKAGKRYVDDDENLPFRTRGFYLHVVIDHRRLPEFIANLSNMPWPTTILRVQQQSTNSTDGSASVMDLNGVGGPEAGGSFGRPSSFGRPGRTGGRPGPSAGAPLGGPMDPGFAGGAGEGSASEIARRKLEGAMADPYLTDVVIAGLMTIYKPPGEADPETEAAAGVAGPAATGNVPVEAGEVPDPSGVVDPNAVADPNAVSPEGLPVEGGTAPLPEGSLPEGALPGEPSPNNQDSPGTNGPPAASNPGDTPAPAEPGGTDSQPAGTQPPAAP
ncbi:MAG: hypothetical protein KDA79_01270, partial [Planctomycetaceae bacterium]|nr:hypothetical protein [Planctomycetaceae bacterium]